MSARRDEERLQRLADRAAHVEEERVRRAHAAARATFFSGWPPSSPAMPQPLARTATRPPIDAVAATSSIFFPPRTTSVAIVIGSSGTGPRKSMLNDARRIVAWALPAFDDARS